MEPDPISFTPSRNEAGAEPVAGTAPFAGVRLLVGVCGAVSAMGTPHVLYWLRSRLGVRDMRVVMTGMAKRFLTPESVRHVLECDVVTDWDDLNPGPGHVTLAGWADVVVVMPTTANKLGKLASGIADDVLTATVTSVECPVILVPAMSAAMWNKPAVQRNVRQLADDGYTVVHPRLGVSLATGEHEVGSLGDFRRPLLTALATVLTRRTADESEGHVAEDDARQHVRKEGSR